MVNKNLLKQGWVYKRGSSSILNSWKSKWMVLYEITAPEVPDETHVGLYIYNSREEASRKQRPKYELDPTTIAIEIPSSHNLRHIKAPFVLKTPEREFTLSAQSQVDRDSWIAALKVYNTALDYAGQITVKERVIKPIPQQETGKAASAPFEHQDSGFAPGNSDGSFAIDKSIEKPLKFRNRIVFDKTELTLLKNAQQDTDLQNYRRGPSHSLHPAESWDAKYVELCSRPLTPSDAHETDLLICELIGSFRQVSEIYAKLIVDSFHKKSQALQDLSVVSEGKPWANNLPQLHPSHEEQGTFLVGNFVFHLASNYVTPNPAAIETALVQTSQELKSISAFSECCSEFNTALMTIIDYKSFRVIAYSVMPLDADTTVCLDLGPDGTGAYDAVTLAKINQVGRQLNLKSHTVVATGNKQVALTIASTTKTHCTDTSNGAHYYVLNLVDLFPSWEPCGLHFRPEFIDQYNDPLSSETFFQNAASVHEQQVNQAEVRKAFVFLVEAQLPKLVSYLDNCAPASLPITSADLSEAFHSHGVNIKFLGKAAELTRLPHVRELLNMEMVARVVKWDIRTKLNAAVAHFRKVEAKVIDEELESYIRCIFSDILENKRSYFESDVAPAVRHKFEYRMQFDVFEKLPKIALTHIMFEQCGIQFELEATSDAKPQLGVCKGFTARIKSVSGKQVPIDSTLNDNVRPSDYAVYQLARHLSLLGSEKKLSRNIKTAQLLLNVANLIRAEGNLRDSKLYLEAALNTCPDTPHAIISLILCSFIENWTEQYLNSGDSAQLGINELLEKIQDLFKQGVETLEYFWNGAEATQHPLVLEMYRTVTESYARIGLTSEKTQILEQSLYEASRIYGKSHLHTADRWLELGQASIDDGKLANAIDQLGEAITIYSKLYSASDATNSANDAMQLRYAAALGQSHYCLAKALVAKGDLQAALSSAEIALKIRESAFDPMHEISIESVKQVAEIVLLPYRNYTGPATPAVKQAIVTAIKCLEREFKYLKQLKKTAKSGDSAPKPHISQLLSNVTASVVDTAMGLYGSSLNINLRSSVQSKASASDINTQIMQLSKTLIKLRLKIATSRQLEVIKSLPEQLVASATSVREVIVKLVHLTPVVYINELLQRVDDSDIGEHLIDPTTVSELHILFQLAEKSEFGVF